MLGEGEFVVTDGGYQDVQCLIRNYFQSLGGRRYYACVRVKHETVNHRIDQFYAVSSSLKISAYRVRASTINPTQRLLCEAVLCASASQFVANNKFLLLTSWLMHESEFEKA